MGYELKTRDDGTVDLVEITPVVIANFRDRAHAERYYGILAETGALGPSAVPKVSDITPPRPIQVQKEAVPTPEPQPGPGKTASALLVKAPDTAPQELSEGTPEYSNPNDEEWEQAFQALADGGDMKKIAAALDVNVYQLRAKYGAWCRNQKKPDPVPSPETGMENCRICDRAFKPTAASDGLCARCSKD